MRSLAIILTALTIGCTTLPKELSKPFQEASKLNYYYDNPTNDYWQTAQETALRGGGDCEDLTFYLMDKLKKENIFCMPQTNKKGNHAFVVAEWEGVYYKLDPTWKQWGLWK